MTFILYVIDHIDNIQTQNIYFSPPVLFSASGFYLYEKFLTLTRVVRVKFYTMLAAVKDRDADQK